jgi:hypothetical protein
MWRWRRLAEQTYVWPTKYENRWTPLIGLWYNAQLTTKERSRRFALQPMQKMQPCAHCEQELPEVCFDSPQAVFCKRCNDEINRRLRKKYNIIQAAHFRAQLRHSTRQLQQHMNKRPPAGV